MAKISTIKFIDLFCGVGGFRCGMENLGFKCVFSCDIDEECRKTYFENFNELPKKDIFYINAKDISYHDILCAGFPCQPFSISGKMKGFNDKRGLLFFEICRIISEKRPMVVLLENVKQLFYHDKGVTFNTIIKNLENIGYTISYEVLNASDFGVPQNRERIIIVGCLNNKKFDFSKIKKEKRKRLLDFLDNDSTFEFLNQQDYTLLDNPKEQKSGLIFAGYRNKAIRKVGVRCGTENLSRAHKQPNRIYSVMGIYPTLSSQEPSGRFFILLEDNRVRKLTLNECWRLMGFPENYKKISSKAEQYKQIGNSVCVPMIEAIGNEIKNQLLI